MENVLDAKDTGFTKNAS